MSDEETMELPKKSGFLARLRGSSTPSPVPNNFTDSDVDSLPAGMGKRVVHVKETVTKDGVVRVKHERSWPKRKHWWKNQ